MKRNHLNTRSTCRALITRMLALVLAYSISAGGVWAQGNLTDAAGEYSFRVQQAIDGQGNDGNTDPTPVLSMSCLAANGYGQWSISETHGQGSSPAADPTSVSGSTEYPIGWYLLANGLYQPSVGFISGDATHTQCIPPGVVQCGPLSLPTTTDGLQAKAVANLDGMVDFIWVNWVSGVGVGFVQSGFTAADIDLSLSFLSTPASGSTPGAGTMNILPDPLPNTSATPHNWPNILVGSNTVASYLGPGDWRNQFDVCADASFIYIIWETIPSSVEQLWVTVIPIGSGTPVAGFPVQVPAGSHNCINPTITCDPRNNRGGGTTPAFDIAYIDKTTEKIMVDSWSGTNWTTTSPTALSYNYWNPAVSSPGAMEQYEYPFEARIIRNSVNGGTSSLAVYAEVSSVAPTQNMADGYDSWLIFYPPTNIFGTANYVAGVEMPTPKLEGHMEPMSAPSPVWTNCITAFADPYDNQAGWHRTDEYHCLFQYDLAATSQIPLCIVRGSDVQADFPPQPDGTTNSTILVLNQTGGSGSTLEDNPAGDEGTINSEYVAAVNQMGIHVHWRTEVGVHFYARDMNRTFDEGIDENTLVTDQCTVSDGTNTGANHGGTLGALIPNGYRMTVWTDPNYGPPGTSGLNQYGLYSPISVTSLSPYIGTLIFASGISSDNIALTVGNPIWSPEAIVAAIFTVMPYFSINFLPDVDNDLSQALIVNANSIFDYYGRIASLDPNGITYTFGTPFLGNASIKLIGTEESGVPNYAYLNVHAGADFYESTISELQSIGSSISMWYGPSVFPTTNGSQNSNATGHMTLRGSTILTNGTVTGDIPHIPNDAFGNVLSQEVIITVDPDFANLAQYLWGEEFNASGVLFWNIEYGGTSELLFGQGGNTGSTQPFGQCAFQNCDLKGIRLHVFDPTDLIAGGSLFLVSGCNFNNIRNKCILIENDQSPTQASYGEMLIEYNHFNNLAPGPSVNDNAFCDLGPNGLSQELPCGIYLRGLDGNGDPNNNGYLVPVISGNYFTYNNGFYPTVNTNANNDWNPPLNTNTPHAIPFGAITLENSTAMVTGNTIMDNGYPVGISIFSTTINGTSPQTFSVICNNTISGIIDNEAESSFDGCGIMASGLFGGTHGAVISMNTITNNDIGIELFDNNNGPGIVYNTITGNREIGIETQGGGPNGISFADMSSTAAGQTSSSAGAFNTISGEAVEVNECEQVEPISLTNGGNILIQNGNNTFTVNPANASGPFSSCPSNFTPNNFVINSNNGTTNVGEVGLSFTSLDGNFWGTGVAPTPCSGSSCTGVNWGSSISVFQINWIATSGGAVSQKSVPTDASCPSSANHAQVSKKLGMRTLSFDSSRCASLGAEMSEYEQKGETQQIYDTGKACVENCNSDVYAMEGIFGELSGTVQELFYNDTNMYVEYRQWLESVLYLNTDPAYFCLVAMQIANTYGSASDTSEALSWKDGNRGLAVQMWLYHHGLCDTAGEREDSITARSTEREEWLNDTLVPFDSTDPTLADLGLDTLFNKELLLANVSEPHSPGIISNATANPNPTGEGTVISFGISQEAYVKIELFDILGHEVGSAGFESLFEPGNKSVPLSLAGLPSGTYFARILTAYGEAQSVKLVKQ